MFCQNKFNSTKLKQMTKDEKLNRWKSKISCKPAQNFVKCLHLNCFLCPKWFRIICWLCKYFYHFRSHQTFIVFCLFARVKR